jgi:hypothetical protein
MMSRSGFIALAGILLLAACGEQASKEEDAGIEALQQPKGQGASLTCLVSYLATRGPIVSESRARVKISVEDGGLTSGWTVESVDVLQPLPEAQGFDPWIQFLPGVRRKFFARDGALLTLAMSEGKPLTLNRATGDLNWSAEGVLGETEYTGGCM